MKLILVSGSGIGAGKTTLARRLADRVYSLADAIRLELSSEYPGVDFYDKSQEAKNRVVLGRGLTVRDLLKEEGYKRRKENPNHWVRVLIPYIYGENYVTPIAVDDIRYLNEVAALREVFEDTVHIHLNYSKAVYEPEFENDQLSKIADYLITRND